MLGTFSYFVAERVPSNKYLYPINLRLYPFLSLLQQDTDTRVNLKNIHMITDKSNCSQLQVHSDKISESWWDLTVPIFWLPLSRQYTMGKASINIVASHTELKILPSLTLTLKIKKQTESESGNLMLIWCQKNLDLDFFRKSEYRACTEPCLAS